MKKIIIQTLGLFLIFSCSHEDSTEIENQDLNFQEPQKLLPITEVNAFIEKELKEKGDVDWTNAPSDILWSAVVHGGEILSVGYGQKGESFSKSKQKSTNTNNAKKNVIEIVLSNENTSKSSSMIVDDPTLNYIDIRVSNLKTITALQATKEIRYLQPSGYSFYLKEVSSNKSSSSFGCDQTGETIHSEDYRIIAPNALLPWNYSFHNIEQAWAYKGTTGKGITVGLIDTGTSASQELLGSEFNNGASFSSGRTIENYGTFIDSFWWWSNNYDGAFDKCGHGTFMSSVIASPRNNKAMPVGIAYNCNLVAYRGTEDVVLNDYHERKGVVKALIELSNRNDVKIISMSLGYPWSIGNVKDAVKYAYSKDKLIVTAGGTSTEYTNWYGVIFPASMNETIAVTGIKENGNTCSVCHDGNEIDFTVVMERSSDKNRKVPSLGFHTGNINYVGGSSIATASVAGMAALVWSRDPNMPRSQVLNILKSAGKYYPTRHGNFGYGNIDLFKAVKSVQ